MKARITIASQRLARWKTTAFISALTLTQFLFEDPKKFFGQVFAGSLLQSGRFGRHGIALAGLVSIQCNTTVKSAIAVTETNLIPQHRSFPWQGKKTARAGGCQDVPVRRSQLQNPCPNSPTGGQSRGP